jgi:enamine deaminase RidA (YjgF/YER057c/UK114 family)
VTPPADREPRQQGNGGVLGRLAQWGLELPSVAAPLAAYVPAVRVGSLIYVSGQLPLVDGELPATGKVGDGPGLVSAEHAAELAQRCALNALAALATQGDLDRMRVAKVVGFVASAPHFTGQAFVINGASDFLGEVLAERGVHARSAVGVAVLPLDAPVEVELIAAAD